MSIMDRIFRSRNSALKADAIAPEFVKEIRVVSIERASAPDERSPESGEYRVIVETDRNPEEFLYSVYSYSGASGPLQVLMDHDHTPPFWNDIMNDKIPHTVMDSLNDIVVRVGRGDSVDLPFVLWPPSFLREERGSETSHQIEEKVKIQRAIYAILKSEATTTDKKQRVRDFVASLDTLYSDKRNRIKFCGIFCDWPTELGYPDGSFSPIFPIVEGVADAKEFYTVHYKCPVCGRHITTITQ